MNYPLVYRKYKRLFTLRRKGQIAMLKNDYNKLYESRQRIKETDVLPGIDKLITAHLLRHSIATHLLGRGQDIGFIEALLAHSYISMTKLCTHDATVQLIGLEHSLEIGLMVWSVGRHWKANSLSKRQAKCLNTWSRRSGLNGRPADYESAALPLSYAGILR